MDELNCNDSIEENTTGTIDQNDDTLKKLFDLSILISKQEQLITLKFTDAGDISKWGSVTSFFRMAHILTGLVEVYIHLVWQFIDMAYDLYRICSGDTKNWIDIRNMIDSEAKIYDLSIKNMNDRIRGVGNALPIRGIICKNNAQHIAMALYCAIHEIDGCRYLSENRTYTFDEFVSLCKQYPVNKDE